jgi:hypothetical protein
MWATADQSREYIVGLYRRVWAHSDATVAALPLETSGTVPWWPEERRHPTLHRLLVHMIAETQRHAGQLDILRELIDGAVGLRPRSPNLPDQEATAWQAYRDRIEQAAREAGGVSGPAG